MFNVESEEELIALNEIAAGIGKKAPISLRQPRRRSTNAPLHFNRDEKVEVRR
jgi:hypothetical protein